MGLATDGRGLLVKNFKKNNFKEVSVWTPGEDITSTLAW